MKESEITKILVELNGEVVDITDLSREEYEMFLKRMHQLIIAYKSVVGYEDIDKIANRSRD